MKKVTAFLFFILLTGQSVVFPFSSNEVIVKHGAANLQKNLEHVGGELYLTKTKLVFEAHGINLQGGTTVVDVNDITAADTGWSKLLGLIPAVPNALKITTRSGKLFRFTCYFPGRWKEAVEQQLALKQKPSNT
jgi:hypothetical protein